MNNLKCSSLLCALLLVFSPAPGAASKTPPPKAPVVSPLMDAMAAEMTRAQELLAKAAVEGQPAPYFISYTAHEVENLGITAQHGAIQDSSSGHRRSADILLRIGDAKLDNTHGAHRLTAIRTIPLPLADDRTAIRRALWLGTNASYAKALQDWLKVKSEKTVNAKEEDTSDDFSKENPAQANLAPLQAPVLDKSAWEARIRTLSLLLRNHPEVNSDTVSLAVKTEYETFVSSEGSRVAFPAQSFRIVVVANTRADDGMDLMLVRTFEGRTETDLPAQAEMEKQVNELAAQLAELRKAPAAEPFDGPALLSGRAAAVFFHEVLGHRLEGQRQRGTQEGETFTKYVGKPILPDFLSVADDPTQQRAAGLPLNGYYLFDDEGQPAQRVPLVEKGVLQQFLMSRLPIDRFNHSNGHGRAQAGRMPTGRQGNLIVSASVSRPEAELRQQLIEEIKKQNKPYGLYFADITSGYTLTGRFLPQAFQVVPELVYRVYADGRPDELVRGVNIVGTPQAALMRIEAAGNKQAVFNGICGAESGSVPVSGVAPALLFSEIEIQKAPQGNSRPPILPSPVADAARESSKESK